MKSLSITQWLNDVKFFRDWIHIKRMHTNILQQVEMFYWVLFIFRIPLVARKAWPGPPLFWPQEGSTWGGNRWPNARARYLWAHAPRYPTQRLQGIPYQNRIFTLGCCLPGKISLELLSAHLTLLERRLLLPVTQPLSWGGSEERPTGIPRPALQPVLIMGDSLVRQDKFFVASGELPGATHRCQWHQ